MLHRGFATLNAMFLNIPLDSLWLTGFFLLLSQRANTGGLGRKAARFLGGRLLSVFLLAPPGLSQGLHQDGSLVFSILSLFQGSQRQCLSTLAPRTPCLTMDPSGALGVHSDGWIKQTFIPKQSELLSRSYLRVP